jgi:hypothetical protein
MAPCILTCVPLLCPLCICCRSVKPHVISLFADMAMGIDEHFERYCSLVLNILGQAGLATMGNDPDDEDLIDYINTLREAIVEAYTGIVLVCVSIIWFYR